MFVFRAVFSGPCVYVPRHGASELSILVVNAREPEPDLGQRIHTPVLLFDLDDLQRSDSSVHADIVPFDVEGSERRRGALFLGREEMCLGGFADAGPVDFLTSDEPLPIRDDPPRFGFNWMPALEEALPGSGRIDNSVLEDVVPSTTVDVRTRLRSGTVYSATLSRQTDGSLTSWAFKLPGEEVEEGDPERPIGLDVGVEGRVLSVASLTLASFETGRRRVLRFAPATGSGEVRIEIANREPEQIFARDHRIGLAGIGGDLPREDPDFSFNYRFSAVELTEGSALPIPRSAGGGQNRGGTTCGGART